jgi:acetolactate decarboxylase
MSRSGHTLRSLRITTWILCCLPLWGCSERGRSVAPDSRTWDGAVEVHGALRAMLHEGQTGPMVSLDSILPDTSLVALGALANLAGEITVVDGEVYLSYPEGTEGTRTEVARETNAGAALLVTAGVPSWQSLRIEHAIRFEELDDRIASLAVSAGIEAKRFPFLLVGDFEDLQWHVVDGTRLNAGETTHQDHLSASVQSQRSRASATLVGFYSDRDQGVFTHMGSKTHIHCVVAEPVSAGHVDHVTVPAGTTVKFPAL